MWNSEDKKGFKLLSINRIGQISLSTEFGLEIKKICENNNYKIFLEIGTWNGHGSTKCFYEGLKNRDNYEFYSLEINKEKFLYASKLYSLFNFFVMHGTILGDKIPLKKDIENLFNNESITFEYLDVDLLNLKSAPDLSYLLHKNIDVILLDGSDYFTYFEYKKIVNKVKVIMLDDVNCIKNKIIRNELLNNNLYYLYKENLTERNGYSIFILKNY
jgi:hypothetical protein